MEVQVSKQKMIYSNFARELQICILFKDDPFEVNLRENYELLEDEHFESMKRVKCLENKIEELKKTHIMIQTTKVSILSKEEERSRFFILLALIKWALFFC